MICTFIPPTYSALCDSPALLCLPLGESTSGPMALMGCCIHFCVAVIICILVLIGIYLDALKIVDSNDSGSLLMIENIFLQRHIVFRKIEQHAESPVVYSLS